MAKHPLPRIAPIPGVRVRGPRPVDFAVCQSKVRYATKEDAKEPGSHVYLCPACGGFHRAQLAKRKRRQAAKQAKQRRSVIIDTVNSNGKATSKTIALCSSVITWPAPSVWVKLFAKEKMASRIPSRSIGGLIIGGDMARKICEAIIRAALHMKQPQF